MLPISVSSVCYTLPSLTISYHLVPASHDFLTPTWSKAQAWRKRCRAFVDEHIIPLCQPMGGAVCRGLPVFCELLGPQFQFPLCVARSTRLCPRRPTSNAQRASLLWISEFHLDFPSQICTKICKKQKQKQISLSKFKTGWSVADRRRPHIPELLTSCPTMPPEELELGRHEFSVWKKSKIFKTLRGHSFALFYNLQPLNYTNYMNEEFKTLSSDVFFMALFPVALKKFRVQGAELDVLRPQDLDYFHELIFVDELARCLGVSPQIHTTPHKLQLTTKFRVEAYIHLAFKRFKTTFFVVLQRIWNIHLVQSMCFALL